MSDAAVTAPAAQLRAGIKLEGRVALVTGGTRGIGAAISSRLASQRGMSPPGTPRTASAPTSSEELERTARGRASTGAMWATPMTACASSER